MKMLIVNNLAAGFGEGSIYDFIRSYTSDGDEIVLRNTDGTTDLRSFVKDSTDFDIVVASGGDGTVSTISYLLANTGVPVLAFPSGVNNLIAQNLLLPTEAHALSKLAKSNNTMDFDIGEATINGRSYGLGGMLGIGYGAVIAKKARPNKQTLGPLAYFGAALSHVPKKSHLKLTLDGNAIETDGVGVLILNFTKIGFDLRITHKNLPRDGKFDIVVLRGNNALEYLPALTAAALDNAINFPNRTDALEIYQASSVEVTADPELEIQIDGETTSLTTPISAKIIHKGVKFIVSDDCIEAYK